MREVMIVQLLYFSDEGSFYVFLRFFMEYWWWLITIDAGFKQNWGEKN